MKSRLRLRLVPEAQADIRTILRYTSQQWGPDQGRAYRAQLDHGLARLRRHPELGQERNDLYQGCRALRIEQHVLYYRLTESEIIVGRVLHFRQDPVGKVELEVSNP